MFLRMRTFCLLRHCCLYLTVVLYGLGLVFSCTTPPATTPTAGSDDQLIPDSVTTDGYRVAHTFAENPESPPASHRLTFEKKRHDFGVCKLGKPVSERFGFRNTSSDPMQLVLVSAECGCTETRYETKILHPGDTSSIVVTYDNSKPGKFMKRVSVRANTIPPTGEIDQQRIIFTVETRP
jgi:hypothetical protein